MFSRASRSVTLRVVLSIVCGAMVAACGGRAMFVPPAGPGTAAPDAQAAWDEATNACRGVERVVASMRVRGRIADTRVWPLSIDSAVVLKQSIYLSAVASGRPVFLLVGTPARATLWLRTDDRSITAAPGDILQALIGVSMSADDLLGVLSGCVSREASFTSATRHGATLAIQTPDGRSFLEQRAGQWQTRAFESKSFTVEFVPPGASIPQDTWVWSTFASSPASLHLSVNERELNGTIPPEVFRVPAGAQAAAPMTLEELSSMWKNRSPQNRPWPAP